jgi:ferredoxin
MGRIAGVTATDTRERLLRAAADVFAERGYDGTRVADIAAAAGVSNGALYTHFDSASRPPRVTVGHEEWAALLTRIATSLAQPDDPASTGETTNGRDLVTDAVKVQIDSDRCQGHGRCYDLAPRVFGEDDEGYGTVLGTGEVPPDEADEARLAVANCPERAIAIIEER